MARLNDTKALKSMGKDAPGDDYQSVTVSTRKVENGYVTSTTRSSEAGYDCTERFSRSKPDIGATPAQPQDNGPRVRGNLSDAVDFYKR